MENPKLYDWMVVVFLHEIFEDQDASRQMEEAIRKAGCSGNIVVFMVRDDITVDQATGLFSFKLTVLQLESAPTMGRSRFKPVHSPDLQINNPDRHCWETAFKYIYSNFYAERNMIISFSHGAAYGINRNTGTVLRPKNQMELMALQNASLTLKSNKYYWLDKKETNQVEEKGYHFPLNEGLRSNEGSAIEKTAQMDLCKNLEILWMSELADALDRCLPGGYIDVFLMVNCYMQLFDNGYTLSKKVKFLVAPEGGFTAKGYDFGKLMQRLGDSPDMPSEALVTYILKDLKSLYERDGNISELLSMTLFANRLKFYPLALKAFEGFIELLIDNMALVKGELRDIRNNQIHIVTGDDRLPLIDAGIWIKLVAEQCSKKINRLTVYSDFFVSLHKKIVINYLVTDTLRQKDEDFPINFGYTGLSLFYPQSAIKKDEQSVVWCANFDPSIPAPFQKNSKWNLFLDRYFLP